VGLLTCDIYIYECVLYGCVCVLTSVLLKRSKTIHVCV
jgi:hypothetical protein